MDVFLEWNHRGAPKAAYFASAEAAIQYHEQVLQGASWLSTSATTFPLVPVTSCLTHFTRLVRQHDLTYMMSDDHHAWQRGHASYRRIQAMAQDLPSEAVAQIWNTWVDSSQMREENRQQFYWRG
jgi:hypothetical protein